MAVVPQAASMNVLSVFFFYFLCWFDDSILSDVEGYEHQPCGRSVASQFSFEHCYLPPMNESLPLWRASFVMSHDSATGYLHHSNNQGAISGATNLYAKNQIGSVYQQLQDGARALDIRPKLLQNGTLILHHGSININVKFEAMVEDAKRWCAENPDELVLIDHGNFNYENATATGGPSADVAVGALSDIYNKLSVTYVECSAFYGLSVGETMELASLATGGGGYLLAMDHHDTYTSSCAKGNWVPDQIVTCYSTTNNNTLPCTQGTNSPLLQDLKNYVYDSINNEPTDNWRKLGPPASLDYYPFNKVQALWQVDTESAALGVAHLSSIIDDNTKSRINARIVDWVYDGELSQSLDTNPISLLMIDHVQLNGNALLSVLRNTCGQSVLSECDRAIPKPKLHYKAFSTFTFFITIMFYGGFILWLAIMLRHYRLYYNHDQQIVRMKQDLQTLSQNQLLQQAQEHMNCGDAMCAGEASVSGEIT